MNDENLPVDSDVPTIEEITAVVLSYTDPNLIVVALESLGWDCTHEIIETISVARQNINLGAKMTAIKYLRTLLLASAEASGMMGSVSKTYQAADGSMTTFSAKHIATTLNPNRKIINSKEKKNVETEETNDGGSPGSENERGNEGGPNSQGVRDSPCGTDGGRDSAAISGGGKCGAVDPGSGTSTGGDCISTEEIFGAGDDNSDTAGCGDERGYKQPPREGETDNPCIEHRPPTCNRELYPGVSGTPNGG